MNDRPSCTFCSHLRNILACGLLLFALAPARAAPAPGLIEPLAYGTTIDLDAGTATFAIHFGRTPDFFTLDDVGRAADAFQFWTDTLSTDPIRSTYDGILGTGPLGTQMMVTTSYLPATNMLSYIWPQLLTDPGPRDPGGWGSVEAYAGYALAPDNTLSFDVPLALLHAVDGQFNYVFFTTRYGASGQDTYFGSSGLDYVPCVPEPAHGAMFGAGMLLLAGVGRHSRRHDSALAFSSGPAQQDEIVAQPVTHELRPVTVEQRS